MRRSTRPATGDPARCGMCGKAVYAGLRFGSKGANQAMTTVMGLDLAYVGGRPDKYVVTGRIHVDRNLCKAMEKMTDEELERPRRSELPKTPFGRDDHNAASELLHPVDDVGVDQDGDRRG